MYIQIYFENLLDSHFDLHTLIASGRLMSESIGGKTPRHWHQSSIACCTLQDGTVEFLQPLDSDAQKETLPMRIHLGMDQDLVYCIFRLYI